MIYFFSGFTLSQEKNNTSSPLGNADLRKKMESISLADLSLKLKNSKKLDSECLNLLKEKIDATIYIRLENELIDQMKTKEVANAMLKLSDPNFKNSFVENFSVMAPGSARNAKVIEYLEDINLKPDLIKKAMRVKKMEGRVVALEKVVQNTERKILEAQRWNNDDVFVPSYDVKLTFEERIDAMIKKNEPNSDLGNLKITDSFNEKKTITDLSKENELVSDLLKLFLESK